MLSCNVLIVDALDPLRTGTGTAYGDGGILLALEDFDLLLTSPGTIGLD